MRISSVSFFALASLAQAHAQGTAPPAEHRDVCSYTIRGYSHDVPAGVNLCWRVPYPYLSEYGLLRCDPKNNFQEIAIVKRGDPRCERYEIRQ